MSTTPDNDIQLTVIYLREEMPGLLLSKRLYKDWRDIADEYQDYMTSLVMTVDEILELARGDWHYTNEELDRLKQLLIAFINSEEVVIPFPDI